MIGEPLENAANQITNQGETGPPAKHSTPRRQCLDQVNPPKAASTFCVFGSTTSEQ
jgi:hypothetical protein